MFAGQAHHLLLQGHDHQAIFRDDHDHLQFLHWLREAARQFQVGVHAYVLMPDHVHLLATPGESTSLSRMMQWIGRHYVPYFNRRHGRAGTLFQGRFKASVVEAGPYLMECCRYIESNPLRVGLVTSLSEFPWSSYGHHAGTASDPLITDLLVYWSLGNTPFQREVAYRHAMEHGMSASGVAHMTTSLLKGWPIGSPQFQSQLAQQTGRRVGPGKRGRPPNSKGETVIGLK